MKQWHILLADDDQDDRFFFAKALEEVPFSTRLTTVTDGEKLLDYLAQHPQDHPDVIFLDLNMPRMNGSECLIAMKGNRVMQHIPVVIYSTSLHEEVADILYKNGAHYYLQKTNFELLPDAISRVLTALANDSERPSRNSFIVKSAVIK